MCPLQSAELLKALGPPSAAAPVKAAKGKGGSAPAPALPTYAPLLESARPAEAASGAGSHSLMTVTCLLALAVGLLLLLLAVSLAQLSVLRGMQQNCMQHALQPELTGGHMGGPEPGSEAAAVANT